MTKKLKGFFTLDTIEEKRVPTYLERYNKPGEPDCLNCGLHLKVKNPKIGLRGEGRKGILSIAEGPGEVEDIKDDNLVGEVGQYFERKLHSYKVFDLRKDIKTLNAVNCRPVKPSGGNRKPTKDEIKFCRPLILKAVEEYKPKVIWLMGGAAIESYFMGMFNDFTVARWLDWTIPDTQRGCWVLPIYHPSFPYRGKDKNELLISEYDRQLSSLVHRTEKLLELPRPQPINYEEQITILTEHSKIIDYLKWLLKEKPEIIIDYETTGKKPHKKGHRIVVVTIDDGTNTVVFPLQALKYWTDKQLNSIIFLYKKVLQDPQIHKSAHNVKFETVWSEVIFNIMTYGWDWCSMINAHILSPRKKITSLKFQSFVRFGVHGYDKEIEHYLKSETEFNNIDQAPLDKLMLYGGMDGRLTRDLKKAQQEEIINEKGLQRAIDFYRKSQRSLANMQKRGIPADKEYFLREKENLTKRMNFIKKKLITSEEADLFRKRTGKPLKITSSKDLQYLLFTLLKHKSIKKTKGGENESTDVEVLKKIDIPFTRLLLKYKQLIKIRDTYLAQFLREITEENRIHPFCNLHIARSYRSTENDPAFQTIPRREELPKRSVRSGIVPSKGNRLSENDFGSHEVRVAACYTQDPTLIKYIVTPGTDMHRDQAYEIFKLPHKQVHDDIRFYVKNGWVFPQFYGSWYKVCAQNIWANVVVNGLKTNEGVSAREWLLSVGIYNLSQFESHCQKVEKDFWDKYKVFKKWQEKVLKTYIEKGYVEMFHGFRRTGYLTKNKIINTPIQGTAYHCLQWSLDRLDEKSVDEKWISAIDNQVHDSIFIDMHPEEQDYVTDSLLQVAERDIRKEFKWIIVPLEIETEWTPIDGNWYQKEKVHRVEGQWIGKKSNKIYNLEY